MARSEPMGTESKRRAGRQPEASVGELLAVSERLAEVGRTEQEAVPRALVSSPLLAALRKAGTRHVYGDTADVEQLDELVTTDGRAMLEEVDGNTVNQPLLAKVLPSLLADGDPLGRSSQILRQVGEIPKDRLPLLYAILCARVGNRMTRAFSAPRPWEVSLQLHMDLGASYQDSMRVASFLHTMVPNAFVKVPFTPDRPHCLLIARDLERAGIHVNLTSTFSARQAVLGALFANVSRVNVFMGRLEQGLEAEGLGEHVVLEAQRKIGELRQSDRVQTQLMAASMRDWRSFVRLAGCDVFTAPPDVLRGFLEQDEVAPDEIESCLDHEDKYRVSDRVLDSIGPEKITRLADVDSDLIEFLRDDLLRRPELAELTDGDELYRHFDAGGFGDLFHVPTAAEEAELRKQKLPDLEGDLVGRLALDTHYSLLANADFRKYQEEIDTEIEKRL